MERAHRAQKIVNSARTTNGTYKINQTATGNIAFPVPPLEEQARFEKIAEKGEVYPANSFYYFVWRRSIRLPFSARVSWRTLGVAMRLSRIEIENFKGIGGRQAIDLKPITLLFGPNSAGKSTILQALHYLREILERSNIDPDVTIAGGLIDLGGFATLVHNHELDRAVQLKVAMDLSDEQGTEALSLNSGLSIEEPEFAELLVRYLVGESEEYRDYALFRI